MTEEKLLPCPFCGERAILDTNILSAMAVYCSMCGLTGPEDNTNKGLTTNWNSLPRFKWRKWPEEKPEYEGKFIANFPPYINGHKVYGERIGICEAIFDGGKWIYIGLINPNSWAYFFWAEIPPIPEEKK